MGLFVILKILYPKNSWNSVWENIFSEGDPCKNVFQKPMDFFFWKNVFLKTKTMRFPSPNPDIGNGASFLMRLYIEIQPF